MMYRGNLQCKSSACNMCSLLSGRPPRLWNENELKAALQRMNKVIAPSKYMATFLREESGLDSIVVPNFVPRPDVVVRSTDDARPHFTFVGVLEKHKGIDLLIRLFLSHDVPAELHVFGKGSLEKVMWSRRPLHRTVR